MPTPSKFLVHRQRLIVELLASGCSRREASRQAQISPKTLRRWLERGSRASEGTSARRFYEAVSEAEAGGPQLLELKRRWENPDMAWLQKLIEPELRLSEFRLGRVEEEGDARPDLPDPEPLEVVVTFSDGKPLVGAAVHTTQEENP